jgi:hypothetical protein
VTDTHGSDADTSSTTPDWLYATAWTSHVRPLWFSSDAARSRPDRDLYFESATAFVT